MSNVCVMLIIPWRHLCMCLFNIWSHSILRAAPYCARSRLRLIPELLAPTPLQSIWKLQVFCLCLCLFVPDFVLFCLSLCLFLCGYFKSYQHQPVSHPFWGFRCFVFVFCVYVFVLFCLFLCC